MNDTSSSVLLIGHRGASKIAPENTLKAFQKAIDLKADYVEFDVHQSVEGELIVIHDPNTFRSTGHKGSIKKMTLSEIKELDAGEGEQIPTLEELITLARGKIGLQLEIKASGLARKIVNALKNADLIESTIISSFIHKELSEVQQIEPNANLAPLLLGIRKNKTLQKAVDNNFGYIHPQYKLISKSFIDAAHGKDIKVNAWTVDARDDIEKLIDMGIDGIITNDIELAKEVLNRNE